jgi:predicted  nucleic acid-binding Zn-ribbon protein
VINIEDKMFELMEKIYIKVTNLESKVTNLESDNKEIKSEILEVKKQLSKVEQNQVTLENEMVRKTDLLLDGYNSNFETTNKIETKVDYLVERTTRNELELKAFVKSKIHQG